MKNITSGLLEYVQVNVTWFDAKGRIVGTGMGNTVNLAADAERTIDVIGLEIDRATTYVLEARTTPF